MNNTFNKTTNIVATVAKATRSAVDDDETISNDFWTPSEFRFNEFLKRDFVLASRNIASALNNSDVPLSFREIKEQVLHSANVIERVLTSKVASGAYRVETGKYLISR